MKRFTFCLIGVALLLGSEAVFASTTGGALQFASKMKDFEDNFNAWLFVASVVLLSATALMHAFGEFGDGMKKMVTAGFWISLAGGVYAVAALFFGSGAVF